MVPAAGRKASLLIIFLPLLVVDGRAVAGPGANGCRSQALALSRNVSAALDKAGAAATPRAAFDPCVGGRQTASRRAADDKWGRFRELTFPSGARIVQHITFVTPAALQDAADYPGTVVASAAIFRTATLCADGSVTHQLEQASDAATDIGNAEGKNPHATFTDYGDGQDDFLYNLISECAAP